MSKNSFFTSHTWLEATKRTWQKFAPDTRWTFYPDELLGYAKQRRHGILSSRIISLNESGRPSLDESTIEFNGFSQSNSFDEGLKALCTHLASRNDWDEIRLGGIHESNCGSVNEIAQFYGWHVHEYARKPGYLVNLTRILDSNDPGAFINSRSANTRQQLRQAKRVIEAFIGPIEIQQADSLQTAQHWLKEAARYHKERWNGHASYGGGYSAFDNQAFMYFHQQLIDVGFPRGEIQMLRCASKSTTIAYLYNFLFDNESLFYLSGINYSLPNKSRPGLVAHWLAIEHCLNMSIEKYNFLAGENRYKKSLSDEIYWQHWYYLQRNRPILRLEQFARFVKTKVF